MLRSLNLKYSNDRFVFTVADEQKQHEFKVRLDRSNAAELEAGSRCSLSFLPPTTESVVGGGIGDLATAGCVEPQEGPRGSSRGTLCFPYHVSRGCLL